MGIMASLQVQDEADSDEDDYVYNPLKLPMGPDGKPIPYWLYKLHGLNQVRRPRSANTRLQCHTTCTADCSSEEQASAVASYDCCPAAWCTVD